MKHCFKCGGEKPLTEFYRHPQMADGHLNKCKVCTKLDVAARYRSPEGRKRIDAYERVRNKTEERRRMKRLYEKKRRMEHPERYHANSTVGNAIRDGRLTRKPCEICGDPKSQAHHLDYAHPLAVRWMCFKHHREIGHGQTVTTDT